MINILGVGIIPLPNPSPKWERDFNLNFESKALPFGQSRNRSDWGVLRRRAKAGRGALNCSKSLRARRYPDLRPRYGQEHASRAAS